MPTASEPGPQHVGTLWLLDLSEPSLIGPIPRVEVIFQLVGSEAGTVAVSPSGRCRGEVVDARAPAALQRRVAITVQRVTESCLLVGAPCPHAIGELVHTGVGR